MKNLILVSSVLAILLSGCQTMNLTNLSPKTVKDSTGSLGEETRLSKGDVYVKMSAEYMRQGNLVSALKNCKKALAVDPQNGQGHSLMAVIYQRLGEMTLAEKHFIQALNLLEGDSYIHNSYGAFLCHNKRYDESDQQFDKALRNPLYRTPEVALTNAGDCAKRQGNWSRAESILRKSLKYDRRLPKTLILMSEILLESKDALSARGYLKRYHREAAESAKSLWLAIRIARELGDRDAVAVFTVKLRNNFPDSELINQLGVRGKI